MVRPEPTADAAVGLEMLLEASSDGYIALDARGTIVLWRGVALDFLESDQAEGLALGALFPSLWLSLEPAIRRALSEGERHRFWSQGAPIAARGQEIEVSPMGQTHCLLQIRESQSAPEADLEAWTSHLQRSNAALSEFAFVASHELRAPLRRVRSFVRMLQEGEQLGERSRLYLERIVRCTHRMDDMVEGVLALAKVQQGDAFAPVDLDAMMRELLAEQRGELSRCGGAFTLEPLPEIWGDERQLRQLFGNLLSNALKYRHPERPPKIQISVKPLSEGWELTMRDNGVGFGPRESDHIFKLFGRLDQSREVPGIGVGLTLAQRIARRHGGQLWASGRPGEGATFTLSLPAQATPEGEAPLPVAS